MLMGLLGNLLKPNYPIPTFLDSASDVSDLTVYTFSAMNLRIPFNNFSIASEAQGTGPLVRSKDKAVVIAAVHSEDALATFDITGVTLGGVAGTEVADQAGSGVSNSALYLWECAALAGISNTDVVVTHSEAVTGCAVDLILVSNLIQTSSLGSGTASSGNTTLTLTDITKPMVGNSILIYCSTNSDQTTNFNPRNDVNSGGGGGEQPKILNVNSNAEFAYACGFIKLLQTDLSTVNNSFSNTNLGWTGAGVVANAVMLLQ